MSTFRKTILVVLFLSLLTSQPVLGWVGNIFKTASTPLDFSVYWNQVTPENSGKWASCEPSRDSWNNWSWLDSAYDYAQNNGYPFKEHCLVWGNQQPDWICGLSQSEQLAEVQEWFNAFSNRYNPDLVDVVNEPLHSTPCYVDAIGGSGTTGWDWVVWSFENYSGGTEILNDYNLLLNTSNASAIANIRNICGADAVGAQGHSLESTSASTISSCFSIIGGTVYVSELDIRGTDSEQLSIYQSIFPTLYNNSAGTTLWGYVENQIWRPEAYLIRTDGSRRPAMDWLYANYLGGTTTTTTTSGVSQSPYPGPDPHPIPGRIEAENYDTGGEGYAYHDTTSGNQGGDYRSDDVDVETCGEGDYNVGWTVSGEWLEFTVDVASAGTYDIEIRVASESAGGNFHIEFDSSNVTGPLSFSATGGWQTYTSVLAEDISLSGGQQIMRLSMDSSNWNVTWIEFTSTDTIPSAPTGLVATAGNETVSLDWNDNDEPDLAGYNVHRSMDSGSGYTQLNESLVTVSEYDDDTVINGIPYFYVVTAVDEASNESGVSNEDSATPDYQTCSQVQAGGDGLLSDLDGDCYVDYVDLEKIVYYWLEADCSTMGDCEGADFEPDDDVDFIDFSTFGLQWMYCNNPEDASCTKNW